MIDTVVEVPTEWNPEMFRSGTANALRAHPEANCMFLASDFAWSAVQSPLEAAGRCERTGDPKHMWIATHGPRFLAYVEQFLAPTLKPGDAVILDNLGSHRGKAVRQATRAAGARLLFLPRYSPDLNPIEQAFGKIKGLLRKAGARTYDAVSDATAKILERFPPSECAAYLRNAGYA